MKSSTTSRVQSPMEMLGAALTSWPRRCVSDKWLVNQTIKVMHLVIERVREDKNKRGK